MKEKILTFIKEHPALNVRSLEREADIPESTIKNALVNGRDIPDKHFQKIISTLEKYGLPPDGKAEKKKKTASGKPQSKK